MIGDNSWMISFLNDLSEIAHKRGLCDFADDLASLTEKHSEALGHVAPPLRRPPRDAAGAEVLSFARLRGDR